MTHENTEISPQKELPDHPGRGGEGPAYDYQELQTHHETIIRLKALSSKRVTNKELAEAVGVHPQTVSNVLNSTLGKRKLERLQHHADIAAKDKMEKIGELADYAIAIKEELLLNPNTPMKLRDRIASDLLDRAGAKSAQKHKHEHEFDKGRMEEIKARAEDANIVSEEKDDSE